MLLLTIVPIPRGAPFVLLLVTVPVALVPIVLLKTTVTVPLGAPYSVTDDNSYYSTRCTHCVDNNNRKIFAGP